MGVEKRLLNECPQKIGWHTKFELSKLNSKCHDLQRAGPRYKIESVHLPDETVLNKAKHLARTKSNSSLWEWWPNLCSLFHGDAWNHNREDAFYNQDFGSNPGIGPKNTASLPQLLILLMQYRIDISEALDLKEHATPDLAAVVDNVLRVRDLEKDQATKSYPMEAFDHNLIVLNAARSMQQVSVFVSIDLEFDERRPGQITEIGLSYFMSSETRALVPQVKTFHITLSERFEASRNGKFVPDHKGYSSQAVSLKLSTDGAMDFFESFMSKIEGISIAHNAPVFYVGHDVQQDLNMLIRNGYYLPVRNVLDTSKIWCFPIAKNQISLQHILMELDFQQRFLHNAANDAYATLMALLRMCDPVYRKSNNMPSLLVVCEMQNEIRERDRACLAFAREQKKILSYKPLSPSNDVFGKDMKKKRDAPNFYGYLNDLDTRLESPGIPAYFQRVLSVELPSVDTLAEESA